MKITLLFINYDDGEVSTYPHRTRTGAIAGVLEILKNRKEYVMNIPDMEDLERDINNVGTDAFTDGREVYSPLSCAIDLIYLNEEELND